MAVVRDPNLIKIRDVWADNLADEFRIIGEVVDIFPYIAMDTEFPGALFQSGDLYTMIKLNVDSLKLIQLGLTFCDEEGNLPTLGTPNYYIWQFNFREFNPDQDDHVAASIELLRNSGIDFDQNRDLGVDALKFSECLMTSHAIMNEEVTWITFHGGYDIGYLVKLLANRMLPETQPEFYELVKTYLPVLYDVKHMIRRRNELHGGLENVARMVAVTRVGTAHQAGSDSLLTSCVFRKVKDIMNGEIEEHEGVLSRLN